MWYVPMNTQARAVQQPQGPPGGQLRRRPRGRACGSSAARSSARPAARSCRRASPATSTTARTRRTRARSGPHPTWPRPSRSSRPRAPPARRSRSSSRTTTADKAIGTYLQSVLNQLGWKASLKVLAVNIQFTYIQNTKNHVQISLSQWYQDYPAASDFLNVLFGCASFRPGSDTSINIAGFCNKPIQAQMDKAEALGATDPTGRQHAVGQDRQAGHRPVRRPRCCSPRRTPTSSRSGWATSPSATSTTCCSTRPGCSERSSTSHAVSGAVETIEAGGAGRAAPPARPVRARAPSPAAQPDGDGLARRLRCSS